MIHDAVRPFFDHDLLNRVAATLAEAAPAVLPAMPVADTLKRADQSASWSRLSPARSSMLRRHRNFFDFGIILAAYEKAAAADRTDFTDDAWRSLIGPAIP